MVAQELRIGNFVKHNSEWCYRGEDTYIFQWDTSDWHALGECTLFMENIEPIPLTEEWLVKLPNKLIYPEWIKFLHELQNWYYWNNSKKELTL